MTLHTNTVTPRMRETANALSALLDASYYLSGGTALALRIGHRRSVDLDYFTTQPIEVASFKRRLLERFAGNMEITLEEKNTLWADIGGVKVSFISRSETLLDKVESAEEFSLAGIRDMTVMKLSALCGREEYKDYVDIACLARHTDPRSWVSWWRDVYPQQDLTSWLIALSAVESVPPVPLEMFGEYAGIQVANTVLQTAKDITAYVERGL